MQMFTDNETEAHGTEPAVEMSGHETLSVAGKNQRRPGYSATGSVFMSQPFTAAIRETFAITHYGLYVPSEACCLFP